jgi:rhodanese-related sulfurtransferase
MNDMIQFLQGHILQASAWLAILIAIIGVELWNKRQQPKQISPQELVNLINENSVKVFDIRSAQLFKQGHILNSKNMPWLTQDEQMFKAHQNDNLVLVCQQGLQANNLAQKLKQNGFSQVCVLSGGLQAWQNAQLPIVKGK